MIAPMLRLRLGGHRLDVKECVDRLASFGALHVTDSLQDPVIAASGLEAGAVHQEEEELFHKAETLLRDTDRSLLAVREVLPGHRLYRHFRRSEEDWISPERMEEVETVNRRVREEYEKRGPLVEELKEVRQYRHLFEEFQPLVEKVGELRGLEVNGLIFKRDEPRVADKVRRMQEDMERITDGAFTMSRSRAAAESYLLIYPTSKRDEVDRTVFGEEIHPVHVPEKYERQSFASSLLGLMKREGELKEELIKQVDTLRDLAAAQAAFLVRARDGLRLAVERLSVRNRVAYSAETFWITGWIPEDRREGLLAMLEEHFPGRLTATFYRPEVAEYPAVPVLLKNPRPLKPFERLLGFFPPPEYGSMDPTPYIAFSFPLFFGLMLGDVGYALALALVGWLMGRWMKGNKVVEDVTRIIYAMAGWTAAFGVFYGELFGKFWTELGLPGPVFHRAEEVIPMLIAVLVMGAGQMILGNLFSARILWREGEKRHAANALFNAAMVLFGTVTAWQFLTGAEARPAAALAALCVAGKMVSAGAMEFLEVFKVASNLLSHARLMAIGTASVVLADVTDDFAMGAATLGTAAVIAVAGHSVNLVMGIFSPTIHALRLHYVEFFNQFYKYGLVKYKPFG